MVSKLKGVFERFDPVVPPVPVIFDVARSGRQYPVDFRSPLPFSVLHDNVSAYVEELYESAPEYGAVMLYALFPNTYIDVNRSDLDIDPELLAEEWPVPLKPDVSLSGLGLLKSKSRYGQPMHEGKLAVADVLARIENYYRPFHAELRDNLDRMQKAWGFAYQISCHCMSAVGAPTHPDHGQERADFCIGDRDGTTASPEFMAFLKGAIEDLGYSCSVNTPYTGGELNVRYGNPKNGIESVMLEINKKLFIDVNTFKKTENFTTMQTVLGKLIKKITDRAREQAAK